MFRRLDRFVKRSLVAQMKHVISCPISEIVIVLANGEGDEGQVRRSWRQRFRSKVVIFSNLWALGSTILRCAQRSTDRRACRNAKTNGWLTMTYWQRWSPATHSRQLDHWCMPLGALGRPVQYTKLWITWGNYKGYRKTRADDLGWKYNLDSRTAVTWVP